MYDGSAFVFTSYTKLIILTVVHISSSMAEVVLILGFNARSWGEKVKVSTYFIVIALGLGA